jgi:general secretion pathway protein G
MRKSTVDGRPSTGRTMDGRRAGLTILACAVLLAASIGVLGALFLVKVNGWTKCPTRQSKIKGDSKSIIAAAEMWEVATGRYPPTLDELKIEGYEQPKDPWSREYLYGLGADGKPRVRCLGRDGKVGGEGEDRDFEEPAPAVEQK